MTTRSTPEYPYEAQTEIWNIRSKHNRLAEIPIVEDFEENYIRSLSSEEATEMLAVAETAYENFEKKQAKKKKKKEKQVASSSEAVDTSENGSALDPEHGSASDPESEHRSGAETPKGTIIVLTEEPIKEPTDTSTKDKHPSEPSDSSSDSSGDEDDPRGRTSERDKRAVRGTTPRIKEHGSGKSTKLFKMEPPKKYSGDKDNERTYDAVQLFLSQLSRYFRLATNVDMRKDISEYIPSFLDGFAYRWFAALDKGTEPFKWRHFEKTFRKKFIPREHIQQAINRYLTIKQGGRSVGEYIVDKEDLENTLGNLIQQPLKETSFRSGLDEWFRDELIAFRELPFEQYKTKAEMIDQDARERKVGPYKPKPMAQASKPTKTTYRANSKEETSKPTKASEKPKKELSRNELRKEGRCFNCFEKGHLSSDCKKTK